jgi:murein DD-endopeptidase MepM/ murein hydrolase activator NlpD
MADENDNININIGMNPAGVEGGARRTRAAVGGVVNQAKELDVAFRRIKSAIDPTFSAQEKYNRAVDANNKLLKAGAQSSSEWANTQVALRAALDATVEAINRKSAAARAASAESRAQAAQEKAQAAQAAAAARTAAREKAAAEKAASQEAIAAERAAKQEAKQLAQEAAAIAKAAAREKAAAEKAASKSAADAEKAAKKEAAAAAREAASAAASAAKQKAAAEREATTAMREAANAAAAQARAERQAADAANELRASIDPQFAAQSRYNEVMRRASALLFQNKLQTGEWIAIQKAAKAQMDINVRSLGRMNQMNVQIGYQMQDVVASWSSGINPLVILAQQGGQTAAALSTMGGSAGRVAAFFAGPWGAAIIGATLLLGYLWQSESDGKKKTLDLMDAETRRSATVKELTDALKDFNKEQREANTNETESLRLKGQMITQTREQAKTALTAAQTEVANIKAQIASLVATPNESTGGAIAGLTFMLSRAEGKVKSLQAEFDKLATGNTELRITQSLRDSEAAADDMVRVRREYEAVEARITNQQRAKEGIINRTLTGAAKEAALTKLQQNATDALTAARKRLKAAEDAVTESRKKSNDQAGREQYAMPVQGRITSGFGTRETFRTDNGAMASRNHGGVDIAAPLGTSVRAANDAIVKFAGFVRGFGNMVELDHGAGVTTRYAHLSRIDVKEGNSVDRGQTIGAVGQTGNATGPHLHYEVTVNGHKVDPTKGFFPIDRLRQEKDEIKAMATAAHELAEQQAAGIDAQEAAVEADPNKTHGQQLTELVALQDKKIAILKTGYGAESKEVEQGERQKYDIIKRYNELILRDQTALLRKQESIDTAREDSADRVAETQLGQASDNADFRSGAGITNERQAVIEKAQILDQEYAQQVAHEERMYNLKLSYLQRELALPNQSPERAAELNAQIEIMQAEHYGRMEEMNANYARNVAQVSQQQATVTMNKWREVASTFTQSLGSAFQGFWTRSLTWRQAMLNIADSLVFKFMDMGLKILENWIVTTLGMSQASQAGEAVITAAKASGAAAQTGIGAAAATTELGQRAATSAAGAYSSTVVIPFIGPVAAPAAAALALAAVLGFASLISAKGGMGEVPDDQLAMVHKKEMILPAYIAEPMRQGLRSRSSAGMFSGASAAGSSIRESTTNNRVGPTFNYQPTHNNFDARLETMLRKDGAAMRKWLRNEARNNNGAGWGS